MAVLNERRRMVTLGHSYEVRYETSPSPFVIIPLSHHSIQSIPCWFHGWLFVILILIRHRKIHNNVIKFVLFDSGIPNNFIFYYYLQGKKRDPSDSENEPPCSQQKKKKTLTNDRDEDEDTDGTEILSSTSQSSPSAPEDEGD